MFGEIMVFWLILVSHANALISRVSDLSADVSCLSYSCTSNSTTSECITVDGTNVTLNGCVSGYTCEWSSLSPPADTNCTFSPSIYPSGSYAYPGEACRYSIDCISGNCNGNSTCAGSVEDERCTLSSQCDVGLYCNGSRCEKQLANNSTGCDNDYYCENGSGCNAVDGDTGTCIPYFSIPPGEPVLYCPSSGVNFLCEFIYCWSNDRGSGGTCTSNLVSNSTVPTPCTSSNNCVSKTDPLKNDTNLYLPCECAISSNASSYCALFPGDPIAQNFFDMYKKWVNSSQINTCNAVQRFSRKCMNVVADNVYDRPYGNSSTGWNYTDYVNFMYYYFQYLNYSAAVDMVPCAKGVYLLDLNYTETQYQMESQRIMPNPTPYKDFSLELLAGLGLTSLMI